MEKKHISLKPFYTIQSKKVLQTHKTKNYKSPYPIDKRLRISFTYGSNKQLGIFMAKKDIKKQSMPLFYKNPQPLVADKHKNLTVKENVGFLFAKDTNSIPVSINEFSLLSKFYPLVFVDTEDGGLALAITGFRENENVFVNSDGKWAEGYPQPAYVHRYPFIFFEDTPSSKLILCIDMDSDFISEKKGIALFKDKEPTELTQNAMQACADYHKFLMGTQAFVKALKEEDLLMPYRLEIKMGDEAINLAGFSIVDEKKFGQLPASKLETWHKNGWLFFVHAHLISISNISRIAQLTENPLEAV